MKKADTDTVEEIEHVLSETTDEFIRGFNKMQKLIKTLKKKG